MFDYSQAPLAKLEPHPACPTEDRVRLQGAIAKLEKSLEALRSRLREFMKLKVHVWKDGKFRITSENLEFMVWLGKSLQGPSLGLESRASFWAIWLIASVNSSVALVLCT